MLKKELRLKKASDFAFVAKKGSIINTPYFNLKYILSKFDDIKVGIVISAKISKKAIIRNKIKRQIRHIVYKYKELLPKGIRIFIQVKSEYINNKISFSELEKILFFSLSEIKNASLISK